MKNVKLLLVASALAVSGTALAATDGTLGATSSGSSVVTIIKDNAVQISDVNDLDLGTHATLAADATASDGVCVFTSTSAYRVTASNVSGTFALVDGANSIAYSLTWAVGAGAPVTMVNGTAITSLSGDNTSLTCGGATNSTFEATVTSAAFNAAAPGTYTDTVTLLVEPE